MVDLLEELADIFTPAKRKKKKEKDSFTREELAEYLRTTPEALDAFEAAYRREVLDAGVETDNLMDKNAQAAKADNARLTDAVPELDGLIDRIVDELLAQTEGFVWDGQKMHALSFSGLFPEDYAIVTPDDFKDLPKELRPQLTGWYMRRDVNYSSLK